MSRTLSHVSRAPARIAGVVLVAVMVLAPRTAAAQGGMPSQPSLVADLAGRDWLKRFDAASAILGLTPDQRTPATIAVVAREITRLQKLKGHGVEELPPTVKDRHAAQTYYDNLLEIASESPDPVVIPVLIGAADDGDTALPALVVFGEAALPQVLAALRRGAEPDHAAGLLYALRQMLENQVPLTAPSRAAVVEVDRRYLSTGPSNVIERAIELAAILGDASLASRLKEIADARTMRDAKLDLPGDDGPVMFPRLSAAAAKALARIK